MLAALLVVSGRRVRPEPGGGQGMDDPLPELPHRRRSPASASTWSGAPSAPPRRSTQAGGIKGKPVKVVGVDTALDPQKGSVEMARLVKDTLVALGPVPEPVIMAAMPIAVENGMIVHHGDDLARVRREVLPLDGLVVPVHRGAPRAAGGGVGEAVPGHEEGRAVRRALRPVARHGRRARDGPQGLGIKVLDKVEVPSDAVTFGPLVVKALDEKPDGIVFVCNAEKIAKIIKELKSRGWTKMDHLLVFSSGDDAPSSTPPAARTSTASRSTTTSTRTSTTPAGTPSRRPT